MSRIMVYFRDGQKAGFDRDKVSFSNGGDNVFSFSEKSEANTFSGLIDDGKALVNWHNVCFVREIEPLPEAPGDGGETE